MYTQIIYNSYLFCISAENNGLFFKKRAQSNQDCFGGSVWTTSTIDNTWANKCFTCTMVWYIETSFELFLNHQLFHQSNDNFIFYVMYKWKYFFLDRNFCSDHSGVSAPILQGGNLNIFSSCLVVPYWPIRFGASLKKFRTIRP